jgi:hypothetical protein
MPGVPHRQSGAYQRQLEAVVTDKQAIPGLTGGLKIIEYRVIAVVEPQRRDSQLLKSARQEGKSPCEASSLSAVSEAHS